MSLICLSIVNKNVKLQRQHTLTHTHTVKESKRAESGRGTGLPVCVHVLRVCVRAEVDAGIGKARKA